MCKTEEFATGERKHWNALSTSGRETKEPVIEETRTERELLRSSTEEEVTKQAFR